MGEPTDREVFDELAGLTTESTNARSADLDRRSVREILEIINDEDAGVAGAVRAELDAIARAVEVVVDALRAGGRLIHVGAGTSGRLGVLDAAECPPTFGTDPEQVQGVIAGGRGALVRAVEGAEDRAGEARAALDELRVGPSDCVVGIAASRRTPFALAALEHARRLGARTILLAANAPPRDDGPLSGASPPATTLAAASAATRRPASAATPSAASPTRAASPAPPAPLGIEVDVAICPVTGPEVIMGSTRMKAGTATKLILNMISTTAMVRLGKVYGNLMVDLVATSRKLRERSKRLLMLTTGVAYEEAAELLERSGGHVKTAIVMQLERIDRGAAEERLARAGGFVRAALGDR